MHHEPRVVVFTHIYIYIFVTFCCVNPILCHYIPIISHSIPRNSISWWNTMIFPLIISPSRPNLPMMLPHSIPWYSIYIPHSFPTKKMADCPWKCPSVPIEPPEKYLEISHGNFTFHMLMVYTTHVWQVTGNGGILLLCSHIFDDFLRATNLKQPDLGILLQWGYPNN